MIPFLLEHSQAVITHDRSKEKTLEDNAGMIDYLFMGSNPVQAFQALISQQIKLCV